MAGAQDSSELPATVCIFAVSSSHCSVRSVVIEGANAAPLTFATHKIESTMFPQTRSTQHPGPAAS